MPPNFLKGISSGTVHTGFVAKTSRNDTHCLNRDGKGLFRHHFFSRFNKKVSKSRHPAAENNHFGIKDIYQANHAQTQIAGRPIKHIQSQRVTIPGGIGNVLRSDAPDFASDHVKERRLFAAVNATYGIPGYGAPGYAPQGYYAPAQVQPAAPAAAPADGSAERIRELEERIRQLEAEQQPAPPGHAPVYEPSAPVFRPN